MSGGDVDGAAVVKVKVKIKAVVGHNQHL